MQYGEAGEWLECPEDNDDFACEGDKAELVEMLCGTKGEVGPNGLPVFSWIRYEREIKDNGEPTKWVGEDADCSEPADDFVSMQEISNHIDYRVFQPLGDPDVEVQPAGTTLVNFPTVVSTDYPAGVGPPAEVMSLEDARVRIPIDIEKPGENLTGEIVAQAGFQWQFEGAGTATGRGKPYEQGVSPKENPGWTGMAIASSVIAGATLLTGVGIIAAIGAVGWFASYASGRAYESFVPESPRDKLLRYSQE